MPLELSAIDVLVTDWDETVTSEDTMAVLSQAAYDHKTNFHPPWEYFGDMYYKDYEKYACNYNERRGSLQEEAEFLSGLKQVELESVTRVENSGLFKDVPESMVRSQASKVKIRQGWWDVLSLATKNKVPIVILSVNWSDVLIEEVLSLHGFDTTNSSIRIYANKIQVDDETGLATGKLGGHPILGSAGIRTAQDKLDILKKIRSQKLSGKATESIAYFGDSSTDTLALLEADLGVVIHKNSLASRLEGLGVAILRKEHDKTDNNQVYYLCEWSDLLT
ncbi:hypothetical protein AWJ20_4613 [Sugiyamaella lignohabitans]|uniref:Uncharacterized protein n=1 Tax=Sugiyamaella lignohabitans TaxID=796027 RepID=A0A167E5L8_9ASCO|nr:uncharacterized protein AWJ20_4613 [Sugiyamaella lignohabitans]ANB13670.1 hypothetical protein AWJ20_4613 [Sugiyamaella lignohabitans]